MNGVLIRSAEPKDWPFISGAWLDTYSNSEHARELRRCVALRAYEEVLEPGRKNPSVYYGLHRKAIERVATKSSALVAYFEEDADLLLGFIVYETHKDGKLLHYICVKPQYQGQGVALDLFEAAEIETVKSLAEGPVFFTHPFPEHFRISPHWRYCPALFYK